MFRERGAASPARLSLSLLFVLGSRTVPLKNKTKKSTVMARRRNRIRRCDFGRRLRPAIAGNLARGSIAIPGHQGELGFDDRKARVVGRVRFIICAIIGDAPNYVFGHVAAGKSSLCVGPIGFRLATMAGWNLPLPVLRVAKMARGFPVNLPERESPVPDSAHRFRGARERRKPRCIFCS